MCDRPRNRVDDGIDGVVTLDREPRTADNIVFTYIHKNLEDPIQIRLQPVNTVGYPEESNFLLTTVKDDADPVVTATLENLQNYTFSQTIVAILCDVAVGLTRALDGPDGDGDIAMEDAADADDAGFDSENDFDIDDFDDDDPDFERETLNFANSRQKAKPTTSMARGVLNKIKRDLRKVRGAGAKVGILDGVAENACTHFVVLSIRARKLGISDEALEAWDVDLADYIVLLMCLDEPYPSVPEMLNNAASSFAADFRIGKCKRFKPSEVSARRAFQGEGDREKNTTSETDDRPFSKLFISNSLEQFMNEQFLAIFKLRLTGAPTWDAANTQMQDLHVLGREPDISAEYDGLVSTLSKGKAKEVVSSPVSEGRDQHTFPTILTWNSFAEPPEEISTPLVALQFALHYFIRCTEYCLQCHRKVDKEFEALKPYVCDNPLCLYQYIALGFGPSVEYEIMTQPYVVDLLVTLCYSSLCPQPQGLMARQPTKPATDPQATTESNYAIRNFPLGLRLKVPLLTPLQNASHQAKLADQNPGLAPSQSSTPTQAALSGQELDPISGTVNMAAQSFIVSTLEQFQRLREDSWVVLSHAQNGTDQDGLPGGPLLHHVYIKQLNVNTISGTFELKVQDPRSSMTLDSKVVTRIMKLFKYDSELDDLDDNGKARTMQLILDTLPPISHMREMLLRQPHSRLKHHNISPSAITLLEWIIASNRSFILQVSAVHDNDAVDKSLLKMIKTRDQEIIPAMDGFVQFRFAMGNPDKELRFHRALKEEAKPDSTCPTLFAWHGSGIHNWHSILRHGLDYNKVVNGRAFGNGVYFSPQFATSNVCASSRPSSFHANDQGHRATCLRVVDIQGVGPNQPSSPVVSWHSARLSIRRPSSKA